MLGSKVSEVMKRDVLTIDKGETVEVALETMERNGVNRLVVTSGDRVVGVLSVRDLMDGLGSSRFERIPARRIYVSALMTEPPITIAPDRTVSEALRLMLDSGVGSLPVVEDGKLVGFITETDLIRKAESFEGSVGGLMRTAHPRAIPSERIVHARAVMLERGARILPVVDQGRLIGVLTEMALAKAFLDVRRNVDPVYMDNVARRILVEDVMVEAPPKLRPGDAVDMGAQLIVENGWPAIPVVDEEEKVVGVFERRALIRRLVGR